MKLSAGAFLAFLLALIAGPVLAQTSPGLVNGQIPQASQWNGYFSAKQDFSGNSSTQTVIAANALTARTLAARASDWANVMDFGAKGDCSNDDSGAIAAAQASLPHGGTVFFPNTQSACYCDDGGTPIITSTTVPYWFKGSGRDATHLKACSMLSAAVITFAIAFLQGNAITDMTVDANGLAPEAINAPQTVRTIFSHLIVENGTTADMLMGNGSSNSQENVLEDVKCDNNFTTTLSSLPAYGLEANEIINSVFVNVICANDKTSNIYAFGGAGNYWLFPHGYNCFSACTAVPNYNFEIGDFEDTIIGEEGDGSSVADVEVTATGFANQFLGGNDGFQPGIMPEIGVQFATGTNANIVQGLIVTQATLGNTVVQAGSGANTALYNYSVAGSAYAPNMTNGVVTVACAGSPTSSFASNTLGQITHC